MALLSTESIRPPLTANRWTAYSLTVWAICMLGFAFDIYEGTIMQLVTPILIKEWGIVPATMEASEASVKRMPCSESVPTERRCQTMRVTPTMPSSRPLA